MWNTSSSFSVLCFRHRGVAWLLLATFALSFAPSLSFAQQPTATISSLRGKALVNGQAQGKGTVLQAGDVIETQAGASVVLVLSDGSQLELGEKTKLDLAELSQTAAGARVSHVKMLWGWLRAKLSPGHQARGSTFEIETPNALVGVKFSQPDVEVSYDPAKQETIGIAHTVELIAINLLTNERIVVPVGTTVIIVGILMKIAAGTAASAIAAHVGTAATTTATETGTTAAGTTATGTTTGSGTGTMVAIGVGAAAAVGGGIALALKGGSNDSNGNNASFTGTFINEIIVMEPGGYPQRRVDIFNLTQNGTEVTGSKTESAECSCCTAGCTVPVTGTIIAPNQARLTWGFCEDACGVCGCTQEIGDFGTYNPTLEDNGRRLCFGPTQCYDRQ